MKSPGINPPLEPRTSGCGAATDSGIKSTLNTNQKMPAMSPAAAAALKDMKVRGGGLHILPGTFPGIFP
jgi:hypothetical protein